MNLIYQALYLKDLHILNGIHDTKGIHVENPPPPIFHEVSTTGQNDFSIAFNLI